LRTRARLTQQDLRDAISAVAERDVTRVAVTRWEGGSRTPGGVFLDAYLHVLDRLAADLAQPTRREPTEGSDA
jgi:transcriptional regulator with XRE-family HTH domain